MHLTYLAFSYILLFIPYTLQAKGLEDFLRTHALEVEQEQIDENLRYFLNPRLKKQQAIWYEGTLISSENEQFDTQQLKFNTNSNSLFLRTKGKIYSIASSGIKTFILYDETGERTFKKGFGKLSSYEIEAYFKLNANGTLSYLSAYPHLFEFESQHIDIRGLGEERSQLTLTFISPSKEKALDVLHFFQNHPESITANMKSRVSSFNEHTFYEVFYEEQEIFLLKHNHSRISSFDSNSLAKHTQAISFDDSSYYISNSYQELYQIKFNKKSIQEALDFAGIPVPKKIPTLRNIKNFQSWLEDLPR